jgi:hypothetical protein
MSILNVSMNKNHCSTTWCSKATIDNNTINITYLFCFQSSSSKTSDVDRQHRIEDER